MLVATASSTNSGASPILLWRWEPSRNRNTLGKMYRGREQFWGVMEFMWKMLMVVLTCTYLFNFFQQKVPGTPPEAVTNTTKAAANASWLNIASWLNKTQGKVGKWV